MSHTSSINNSSFIHSSASLPSLDFKRDLTAATATGKTPLGRSIQKTVSPKFSLTNKIKGIIFNPLSRLMFWRKAKMAPINRVDNSLALLRSEFEQKLAEKEAKITSLQQAYDKNHDHISRSLRKILAVSENLSDFQQRSEARFLEIEARLAKLERSLSDSKSMGERTTRAGSLETLSSLSSVESHGLEGAIGREQLALTAGPEQLALTAGQEQLALTVGQEQLALTVGQEQLALTVGQEQLALTVGQEQLALTAGQEQLALTAGQEQLALTVGQEQLALTAGPKQLALTAGESLPVPGFSTFTASEDIVK